MSVALHVLTLADARARIAARELTSIELTAERNTNSPGDHQALRLSNSGAGCAGCAQRPL